MEKYKRLGWSMLFTEVMVIVLIGLSMFFYPEPYAWAKQFLSALGLTRLPNGTVNWISCLLFNLALAGAGIVTAAYFIMRSREFKKTLPRWIMGITGTLGGISLLGIGLIPYNIHPEMHNWATYISPAIGGGIMMTAFQGDTPFGLWLESINWCIFATFVATVWLCLNYLAFHAKMLPSRPTAPFMQKMIVAFFLCYMIYHTAALLLRARNST